MPGRKCFHRLQYMTSNPNCLGKAQHCNRRCSRQNHKLSTHQYHDIQEFITNVALLEQKQINSSAKYLHRVEKIYLKKLQAFQQYFQTIKTKIQTYKSTIENEKLKVPLQYVRNHRFDGLTCQDIHILLTQADKCDRIDALQQIINKFQNSFVIGDNQNQCESLFQGDSCVEIDSKKIIHDLQKKLQKMEFEKNKEKLEFEKIIDKMIKHFEQKLIQQKELSSKIIKQAKRQAEMAFTYINSLQEKIQSYETQIANQKVQKLKKSYINQEKSTSKLNKNKNNKSASSLTTVVSKSNKKTKKPSQNNKSASKSKGKTNQRSKNQNSAVKKGNKASVSKKTRKDNKKQKTGVSSQIMPNNTQISNIGSELENKDKIHKSQSLSKSESGNGSFLQETQIQKRVQKNSRPIKMEQISSSENSKDRKEYKQRNVDKLNETAHFLQKKTQSLKFQTQRRISREQIPIFEECEQQNSSEEDSIIIVGSQKNMNYHMKPPYPKQQFPNYL